MCTRPITKDGNTFACRSCDQCISTRRAGWVARAMMEKAQWPHSMCVALTYSDETQENRDAARIFAYADVRAFMKRLLRACTYRHPGARVRFLCAGEQGDRNERCHWHLILFSDVDLTSIGTFSQRGNVLTKRDELLTVGKQKRRLDWSIWGKGFVTLQEPDEHGMAYVLSYCLKDAFIYEKSKGTMREAHVENFATGLFRMSKRPAIGEAWLMQKMESLEALGAVLPSLQIKIPQMSGYWHPNGSFRQKVLWALVALNQRIYWRTGAYAPQWSALLASCQDNPTDLEVLHAFQKQTDPDQQSIESALDFRQRESAGEFATRQTRRKCGGRLPCTGCLSSLSVTDLDALGVDRDFDEIGEPTFTSRTEETVAERQHTPGNGLNPYCQNRGGQNQKRAFPRTAPSA
jgi:hypothetical protein